jgi:polyhydroxyalkanoate synthase
MHGAATRMARRDAGGPWQDPDTWQAAAPRFEGSWWTAWHDWLLAQGSGRSVPARQPAEAGRPAGRAG